MDEILQKLIPRNVAAARLGSKSAARLVTGNPASTRLESGVGNCFPGLECDLRNLERRFFPFLEVDINAGTDAIAVVGVDMTGVRNAVQNGSMPAAAAEIYREIATDTGQGRSWSITKMRGTFGPLGEKTVGVPVQNIPSAGEGRLPPDSWTAIRLLTEGTNVEVTLRRGNSTRLLAGERSRYLDDNGALAAMFLPGELTQSLCSPWTHDFRDCGCFYWASNHPDIVLPPITSAEPGNPELETLVPWERADREINTLPRPATSEDPVELRHYEINAKWQSLNFVVERREQIGLFRPGVFAGIPLGSTALLITHLEYAAGVELAVIQEYLSAAYSLKTQDLPANIGDNVIAARAEMMRVAFSEMRHLRAVNDVLMSLQGAAFAPALRVASRVPGKEPGTFRPVQPRPLTPEVLGEFIDIERPSVSVDGLYSRILATLENDNATAAAHTIRSVMADGQNHFETFGFVQEWLNGLDPATYLLAPNLQRPPAGNALHSKLQQKYKAVLELLFDGYSKGIPVGAQQINDARDSMLGASGIEGAAQDVASAKFLVAFDVLPDPRFQPVDHP
jgi:hypothetical protein